ncbi:hypothetical protein FB451DRAFT_490596 [Mycena latifolia]|nr:hypothetical protein FB451DRAFT_490596 [Mycena latifolia]
MIWVIWKLHVPERSDGMPCVRLANLCRGALMPPAISNVHCHSHIQAVVQCGLVFSLSSATPAPLPPSNTWNTIHPSAMIKSPVSKAAEWLRATFRPLPREQQQIKPWPVNPPPLPEDRIDIGQRPLEEQLPSCHFLQLPLEVRQFIYELALGGRVISLKLVEFRSDSGTMPWHYAVRSAYYVPSGEEAGDGPNRRLIPAERIPIALLAACRQVYLEALPILHGHNTFHFQVHELEVVALAALGKYCLPGLRSVHLFNSWFRWPRWSDIAAFLQQMRLENLALEFEFDMPHADLTHLELDRGVPDGGLWTGAVVKIRNLRQFNVFLTAGDPAGYPDPAGCPTYRKEVVQHLRDLMIGPEADERYRVLLEERAERLEQQRRAR